MPTCLSEEIVFYMTQPEGVVPWEVINEKAKRLLLNCQ